MPLLLPLLLALLLLLSVGMLDPSNSLLLRRSCRTEVVTFEELVALLMLLPTLLCTRSDCVCGIISGEEEAAEAASPLLKRGLGTGLDGTDELLPLSALSKYD